MRIGLMIFFKRMMGGIVVGLSDFIVGDVTGNQGGNDYWVIRLDVHGSFMWEKSFDGSSGFSM